MARTALVQSKIVLPTTHPFMEQKRAIMDRVKCMIDAAANASVNILCLQVVSYVFCCLFPFVGK